MDLLTAKAHLNEGAFFRDRDLPACSPLPVRMLSTTPSGRLVITTQLDPSKPTSPAECFEAEPEELHFEATGFDDVHDTEPAPTTPRSEPSAPVTDRMLSIEVIRARR